MTETFADAVDRLHEVLVQQVDGWKRLLDSTRDANRAVRDQDPEAFDRVLAEQVETLRELKQLEHRRERTIRDVGPDPGEDRTADLTRELKQLALEVGRQARIGRLVIERNGALVEARLALHRRAGHEIRSSSARVDRTA